MVVGRWIVTPYEKEPHTTYLCDRTVSTFHQMDFEESNPLSQDTVVVIKPTGSRRSEKIGSNERMAAFGKKRNLRIS
jgi:hypothetical protein